MSGTVRTTRGPNGCAEPGGRPSVPSPSACPAALSSAGRRLAADLDPEPRREARGDSLARDDVRAALGDAGEWWSVVDDEGVEGEQLVLERLVVRAHGVVATRAAVGLGDPERRRGVQEVGRREFELDRRTLANDPHLFAVRG